MAFWLGNFGVCAQSDSETIQAVREQAQKAHKELDEVLEKDFQPSKVEKAKPVQKPSAESAPPKTQTAHSPQIPQKPSLLQPEQTSQPIAKPPEALPPGKTESITWNFESGDLRGWTHTGEAFSSQPTYGDNASARQRGQPSQHQGEYWIGTYEKRRLKSDAPGQVQGDGPTGTLTSESFTLARPILSFLVGGGCDARNERVELLIDGKAVLQATGKCSETMERVRWDVQKYVGKQAQIRIADESSGGWGHINVDDVIFSDSETQPTDLSVPTKK